jgi:hypothetical protein
MSRLLDTELEFGQNADGVFEKRTQAIPDDFLDTLKSERHAKSMLRSREFNRVASVPTFVVELWNRQGFDFYRMTPREIVNKLNADELGSFVTTPKSV